MLLIGAAMLMTVTLTAAYFLMLGESLMDPTGTHKPVVAMLVGSVGTFVSVLMVISYFAH